LALLGWGPSTPERAQRRDQMSEILSMDDLIKAFSLEGINRDPAVIDEAKLIWLNRQCFRNKLRDDVSIEQLALQLKAEVCLVFK
jgi:glutamyl-tRNA synthetase